jgi:hypothetical protein
MPVFIEMKGKLDPVVIGGSMERFVHELNMQSAQGKQFLLLQAPDDTPIGINVREVLTVRPQRAEDAFFNDTVSAEHG